MNRLKGSYVNVEGRLSKSTCRVLIRVHKNSKSRRDYEDQ